jgi:charged multivesicular body protein 7
METVASGEQKQEEHLILHADPDLIQRFAIPKVGKPLALGAVVIELQMSRALIPLSSFLTSEISIYSSGWLPGRLASYVVGKPLWWVFEQLGLTSNNAETAARDNHAWFGDYVMVELLEKAADMVLRLQRERSLAMVDNLYDLDSFRETFSRVAVGDRSRSLMSDSDSQVLLKYLERDKSVIVRSGEMIKFFGRGTDKDARRITNVDCGILELKNGSRRLENQMQGIQQKIDECTHKASTALKQRQQALALNFLRLRRIHEVTLAKRMNSLQTLQTMALQIENACQNIEVRIVLSELSSFPPSLNLVLATDHERLRIFYHSPAIFTGPSVTPARSNRPNDGRYGSGQRGSPGNT